MDLHQLGVVRAVEDDEHALAVVVELGALAELLAVLDGEVGDAEQLAERVEIGVARVVQVQPEELLALVERADRVEVDGVENLHPAPPKLAAAPDKWLA